MEWCPLYLKRPCPFLSSECSVPWKKAIGVYNCIYHPQEMDFFVWLSICFQKLMRGARILLCLVAQSRLTLCDPMDCSPQGSSVHGILQARILEWVVIPFSRGTSQPRDRTQSPILQADSLPSEPQGKPHVVEVKSFCCHLSLPPQLVKVVYF